MNSEMPLELPALSLAWIDTVGMVLIGVMLLLGAFRGLWWQVIRLVGLAGAVFLARALSPRLTPALQDAIPDLSFRFASGTVWLVIFLAGLTAATLLGLAGRKLLKTMQLGLVDRAGGAFAGLLTGALIHVALVAVLCQLAPEAWVSRQVGGTYSEVALEAAGTQWDLIVGPEAGRDLDRIFERARNSPTAAESEVR